MPRIDQGLATELHEWLNGRLTTNNDIDTFLRMALGVRLFDEYATNQPPKKNTKDTYRRFGL